MKKPYTPREGSMPARLIAHLQEHGGSMSSNQIAELLGIPSSNVQNNMAAAVHNGALVRDGHALRLPTTEDAAATSAARPPRRMRTLKEVAAEFHAEHEKARAAPPLNIVMYGDGDVAVKGHMVATDDDATAVFTREQLQWLVKKVTQPLVCLEAAA